MKIAILISVLTFAGCITHSTTVTHDSIEPLHGAVTNYWPSGQLAEQSEWAHGVPISGVFYDENGVVISEIKNGTGWRHLPGHSEYFQDGKYKRGAH